MNASDHNYSIQVQIQENKSINAHTELGGKILLNTGLLQAAQSPEEIAAVLAHEIEHVHHRHILSSLIMYFFTVEGISLIFSDNQAAMKALTRFVMTMNFTRSQEKEADKNALLRLQKARVSNQGFKDFFTRMGKEENKNLDFLSNHPSNNARLQMAKQFRQYKTTPVLSHTDWLVLKKNSLSH